jgi:hypothetical protein
VSPIKVGDKVWWLGGSDMYEVVLAVTNEHAFMVWLDGGTSDVVRRVPLSELTLVQSAPLTLMGNEPPPPKTADAFARALGAWKCPECDPLQAENARLREALQMAVDTIAHNGPDGVSMAAALGIRPSIRHKETP